MDAAQIPAQPGGFAGLRVLAFESRHAAAMSSLISGSGGHPTVAPALEEVPLEDNHEALAFARALVEGGFDVLIFLTGVGTRMLLRVAETLYQREQLIAALRRTTIVARGPKPVAALAEFGVSVSLAVPEPNTWKDLLQALDDNSASFPLAGRRAAVQEYGAANPELLGGLAERGARVTRVPVYQWKLPEDTAPLREAVRALLQDEIDVVLFTTSMQVVHLFQIAAEMNAGEELRRAFTRVVVGSIGPVTSEALRERGLAVDFEPEHPKMRFLVNEAALRGAGLLRDKKKM